ncbi:MAG: lysophospholipid acyltransferase family protein [Candidatus Brocadiaceae bacterium]
MAERCETGWEGRLARLVTHPYFAVAHRLRWEGQERVPLEGPAVLAANHQSFLDPVALGLALPRPIVFMGAAIYYRAPVVGPLMRLFRTVPVEEDAPGPSSIERMLGALQKGSLVGIFPEGQRTRDGLLGLPHEGVATLALRSGAPLIPATIAGAYAAWPVGRLSPRLASIRVYFGHPFRVEGESTRLRRREVTRDLMLRIADGFRLLGEPERAARSRRRLLTQYRV